MAKILVVDDEKALLELVMTILKEEGHTVSTARIYDIAVKRAHTNLNEEPFDFLVTDYTLNPLEPWKNGLALSHELELPTVLMSGEMSRVKEVFDSLTVREEWPVRITFLAKPFVIDELLAAVTELLTVEQPRLF